MKKLFQKLILLAVLGICSAFLGAYRGNFAPNTISQDESRNLTDLSELKKAFDNQQGNFQVKQSGRVSKILRDDDKGARHQRFIVQLESDQKILIAHNTDLAPKVEGLKEGDMITFYGEYEWNNKGGVIHWTHRDPRGNHPDGWLLYGNRKYE